PWRQLRRLPGYDYWQDGAYYVTCVCQNRETVFQSPQLREIAEKSLTALEGRYNYVQLDEWVIMPNHCHFIIWLGENRSAASGSAGATSRKPLGRLVGVFKTTSASQINLIRGTPGAPVWQENFFERIIRDDAELTRIREYIQDNPRAWAEDP